MTTHTDNSLTIRILTHNIRTSLTLSLDPKKRWGIRKQYIINQLHFETIHIPEAIICLQEARHGQLQDILNGLNSRSPTVSWKSVGCGRDGGEWGEYSPIIYRSSIWDVEWSATKWLSDTPDKPSYSWGSWYRRIVTSGVLRHKETNRRILAMNTHLDDSSVESRFKGAHLILKWVDEWLKESKGEIAGLFLAGDFNTESQDQSDAYGVLTAPNALSDSKAHVDESHQYGNKNSWTDFNDDPNEDALYDYILVGPVTDEWTPWNVETYAILPNKFDDGVFSSDHRPVVVDVGLSSYDCDGKTYYVT
ncbi:hypothetical protein ASPWEDRAFT_41412 [Aspergillus wentii DTO 134E9]|uniref:Endonuclease/exonuclease/phosphatase domain-containing protein n=1 Tax=Aspergillus wentii DTO 134E9 TaxID=1073089 RepID=A0A1L9RMM2_ASPWE|nr:uncharacterized protein ASPWEDRAFT_41412 [Aspergillus wentii DTO 134E9]KAI9929361.1 hypothetical protein MW887_000829 [Aspergillus wentii]OJJ36199.1 hypothetical protein ASPWEDRAFT_41412 [Aspergillus wentii DTO 134E9]